MIMNQIYRQEKLNRVRKCKISVFFNHPLKVYSQWTVAMIRAKTGRSERSDLSKTERSERSDLSVFERSERSDLPVFERSERSDLSVFERSAAPSS